jgi:curved DNA-binding protein CbpA
MQAESHYDVLGVTPDVSQDKIHRAYTQLLRVLQGEPDTPELRSYLARAKLAYQVLSHPESRAAYHRERSLNAPPQRKWDSEEQKEAKDPAVAAASWVTSIGTPIAFFTLVRQGADLELIIVVTIVDAVLTFGLVWGAVKLYHRFIRRNAVESAENADSNSG